MREEVNSWRRRRAASWTLAAAGTVLALIGLLAHRSGGLSWVLVALGLVAAVGGVLLAGRVRPADTTTPAHEYSAQLARGIRDFDQPVTPAARPAPEKNDGDLVIGQYEKGAATHPLGAAAVRAAADWRRLGFSSISRETMFDLAPGYLPDELGIDPGEDVDEAIAWATAEFGDGDRLVEPLARDHYRALDVLVERLTGTFPQIPNPTWDAAVRESAADPRVATTVGNLAWDAGRPEVSVELWRGAAAHSGAAAFNLGVLREDHGDLDAAATAYHLAIDSGDADYAPRAAYHLGGLRSAQGDADAAISAWQVAMDSGHADHAADAAMDLGNFHAERGDYSAAVAAFQFAADSGHPDHAAQALVNVGIVRQVEGDAAAAAAAYRRAIESGRAEVVHRARALLADLPAAH